MRREDYVQTAGWECGPGFLSLGGSHTASRPKSACCGCATAEPSCLSHTSSHCQVAGTSLIIPSGA